jgi:hypothetical protein
MESGFLRFPSTVKTGPRGAFPLQPIAGLELILTNRLASIHSAQQKWRFWDSCPANHGFSVGRSVHGLDNESQTTQTSNKTLRDRNKINLI